MSSYLDFNAYFHHYKHGQHSGCVVRIVARKETLAGACIDKLAHLGSTNVVPLTSCCPTCVFISVNFKQNPSFSSSALVTLYSGQYTPIIKCATAT